jgi:hypothetical protein
VIRRRHTAFTHISLVKLLFRVGKGYRIALYCTALAAMFATRYALVEGILSILPRKIIAL